MMFPRSLFVLLGIIIDNVSGHAILTKPKSKNAGNFTTPSIPLSSYFGLASFGIIDKAFFDGDHSNTPWSRPGEFDFYAAQDVVPGHPQLLHPCGCNAAVDIHHCVGVHDVASGFGETTLGAIPGTPPSVIPPNWALGSTQETAWNAYANHAGGYIYMLCKKTKYDECRDNSFPNGPLSATQAEVNNYLTCVWNCFESNTLEWDSNAEQRVQYQDDECTYASMEAKTKVGKDDHEWRYMPIPDTAQITNGGEGWCTYDNVLGFSNDVALTKFVESFGLSSVCDTGPHAHGPKNWHIIDTVKVPSNIDTGEYLLSWRWDGYMADQMWTNCADVQIVQTPQEDDDDENKCSPNLPISNPTNPPQQQPVSTPTNPPQPVSTPTNPPQSQPTNPGSCVDNALTDNWGADGRTCDTYQNHGGDAYCAHQSIKESCCFCGGGTIISDPPTDTPVVAPTDAPVVPPTTPPVVAPTDAPVVPPTTPPFLAPTDAPVVPPTTPPVLAPTDAPVASPTLEDSSTWYWENKKGKKKRCGWVAKKPERRCKKKGNEVEEDGSIKENVRARDACLLSCQDFQQQKQKNNNVKARFFPIPLPPLPLPPVETDPNKICLDRITDIMNSILNIAEEFMETALDPLELENEMQYTIPSTKLPIENGCTADAELVVAVASLTGLGETELNLEAQPGGTCNLLDLSFDATWVLSKTMKFLKANTYAYATSEVCEEPFDARVEGEVIIPNVSATAQISAKGRMKITEISAEISNVTLDSIDFDVPSIIITFLAESPLGDFQLNETYENFIDETLKTIVTEQITSIFNEAIQDLLPLTVPPNF